MMNVEEILKTMPIFSNLESVELQALAKRVGIHQFAKGDIVFHYGKEPADFHILLDGQLKSVRYTEEGKEVVLHMIQARETFALIPAYLNIPYTGTAVVLKASTVGRIERKAFLELLSQYPEIALRMMGTMARQTKELLTRIEDQTVYTPIGRLVRFLVRESQKQKTGNFQLPMNKADLAKTLGTTPETLSRCIAELAQDNAANFKGKHVEILDEVQLLRAGHSICEEKQCWSNRCKTYIQAVPPFSSK